MSTSVYIISDSLGETAEFMLRAALCQFTEPDITVRRFAKVRSQETLQRILDQAATDQAWLIYTFVLEELRQQTYLWAQVHKRTAIDLIGPIIGELETHLQQRSLRQPGMIRTSDFIEFADTHDDGRDPGGILNADLTLIGVSRTSKTPLSMYLATKLVKTANIPLVPEVRPAPELFKLPKEKIIGLTIDPYILRDIRLERVKSIGLDDTDLYSNLQRITYELDFAREVMENIGCHVIDVSNRAVEETASEILLLIRQGNEHG